MLRREAPPVKASRLRIARGEPPDEADEEDPDSDHQRHPVAWHLEDLHQHDAQANERDDQPGHHERGAGPAFRHSPLLYFSATKMSRPVEPVRYGRPSYPE